LRLQDGESPINHRLSEIELVKRVLAEKGGADRAGGLDGRIALSANGVEMRQEPSHFGTQIGTLIHRHGGRNPQGRSDGAPGAPVGGAGSTAAGVISRRVWGAAHEATARAATRAALAAARSRFAAATMAVRSSAPGRAALRIALRVASRGRPPASALRMALPLSPAR
jgi:hypothetical protein